MSDDASNRIVRLYVDAWNERDDGRRRQLLDQAWAESGVYIDPTVNLVGREALAKHIARVQANRPGARIELTSGVDSHHALLRFHWQLVRPDGATGPVSIDFGELAADGKLTKIIGFFGPPPAPVA